MSDPLDSLTTEPDTGRNAYMLQGAAYQMMRNDLVHHLVHLVREEFDLVDPIDEDDIAFNERIPRATIRARVLEIATETIWTGDLEYLNFLFRPDETLAEIADPSSQDLPPELLDMLTGLTGDPEALGKLFHPNETPPEPADQSSHSPPFELLHTLTNLIPQIVKTLQDNGLLDNFRNLFLNILTDRIIEGKLNLPRPLPSWFAHRILDFPFEGDRLIVAFVTRLTDIEQVIADLRAKYAQLFVSGERDTRPRNAKRNMWVLLQYIDIRDADVHPAEAIHDELPNEPRFSKHPTIYDELLMRFEASLWKDDIAHCDLDTPEGQTEAKNFLRNIIRQQRERFRQIMDSIDNPPEEPV